MKHTFQPRERDAPYKIWGDGLEPDAVQQLKNACKLPVAVSGALMPDAHIGYGLPIGGVLATDNAVIPYAVGVDIACRMKMTVLDLPLATLETDQSRLAKAIERETRFGVGASFKSPRQHDVMDADWSVSSVTSQMKDRRGRSSARAAAAIISSSSAGSLSGTKRSAFPRATISRSSVIQEAAERARTSRSTSASSRVSFILSCQPSSGILHGSIFQPTKARTTGRRWS